MKSIYQIVFRILHRLTPTYSKKDLNALSKTDKLIVGVKYWLTSKLLD